MAIVKFGLAFALVAPRITVHTALPHSTGDQSSFVATAVILAVGLAFVLTVVVGAILSLRSK